MTRKVRSGQAFKPPSMADHNLIADSAEDYRRRILGGADNPPREPVPHSIVKVSPNYDARRGEIAILIGGIVTNDIHVAPERIIFQGSVPEASWWPTPGGAVGIFMDYTR